MTIIKWRVRPEMERYFGRDFENNVENNLPENCGCMPETNIRKHDDFYRIEMAAPGRSKENFNIQLEENILNISYESVEEKETNPIQYLRREFEHGDFSRHFSLPETVDQEKISAKYENGILHVNIPFEDPEKNRIKKSINVN